MTERSKLDEHFDPHDDFPSNPREAAEQLARAAEWLSKVSRTHGHDHLSELFTAATLEAEKLAKDQPIVN